MARPGAGAPPSEMQHSRLTIMRSASCAASTISGAKRDSGPASRSRSATNRPSMVSPPSASLIAKAMSPAQADEVRARDRPPPLELASDLAEQDHLLGASGAQWLHESASVSELERERIRDRGERCGDDDRVVGRVVRQALGAVADDDLDVLDAGSPQPSPGLRGQVGPALDAPDASGESTQKSRLPSETRADLENPLSPAELECLHHPGDERRLSRHLLVADRQRCVQKGAVDERRGYELGARDVADRG